MLFNVSVPMGLVSGDTFQCTAGGQMWDVVVPAGVRAGESVEVDLPVAEPEAAPAPEDEPTAFIELVIPITGLPDQPVECVFSVR